MFRLNRWQMEQPLNVTFGPLNVEDDANQENDSSSIILFVGMSLIASERRMLVAALKVSQVIMRNIDRVWKKYLYAPTLTYRATSS